MRKTPHEKGFTIPVKRQLGPGRFQKGWARSLEPVNGKIQVCYDSGKRSSWSKEVTIHEPLGFEPIATICCECGADTEHYLTCSQSEI